MLLLLKPNWPLRVLLTEGVPTTSLEITANYQNTHKMAFYNQNTHENFRMRIGQDFSSVEEFEHLAYDFSVGNQLPLKEAISNLGLSI